MDIHRIYEEIALRNGVSIQKVEKEIAEAIDIAWLNPNKTPEIESAQQQVKSIESIPSPEELIQSCVELIQARNK